MEHTGRWPDGTQRSRGVDLVLSYVLSIPILLGAVAAYAATPQFAFLSQNFTLIFASAVLLFLAGSLRGTDANLALPLLSLVVAIVALYGVFWGFPLVSAALQSLVFLGLGLAARHYLRAIRFGPAPLLIALAGTAALAGRTAGLI